METTRIRTLAISLAAAVALLLEGAAPECRAAEQIPLDIARIYFEYNATDNDLGVHIFLDGEDWRKVRIVSPKKTSIFNVEGTGSYKNLGLTELFFEGAEPSLAEFPLDKLLALFPEGNYQFKGKYVDGAKVVGTGTLSHAIPAGPSVSAALAGNSLVISWTPVAGPPVGFPAKPINIVKYQVIVGTFQVIVPAPATMLTVSPEFVASLPSGENGFEVLAIEASGNQTLTMGSFVKP